MKFEEKKRMKKRGIVDLFKGLGEMIEKEELKIGGKNLFIPDDAKVEVEYKEKDGKAKLEVEVKWRVSQRVSAKEDESNMADKIGAGGSISDVKQGVKRYFNEIRKAVEAGRLASPTDTAEFAGLNKSFKRLAKGESYEKDMVTYMELTDKLTETVKTGNLEEAKTIVEDIRAAKKTCHKTYRRKDE